MGRRKGFPSPKPDLSQPIVIEQLDPIATTTGRLELLLAEILRHRLSPRCYGVIKNLAQMPPAVRLALNIKTVVNQLSQFNVSDVLSTGITRKEREVLEEIDASSISSEARRTAHSLMSIDVRANVISSLRGVFKDMRTRHNHMLADKPLD